MWGLSIMSIQLYKGAQINFGEPTPFLTFGKMISSVVGNGLIANRSRTGYGKPGNGLLRISNDFGRKKMFEFRFLKNFKVLNRLTVKSIFLLMF